MNCDEATPLAQAYADGELDLVRTLEVEEHLRSCSMCSQASQRAQWLKKMLSSVDLYHPAPPLLSRQIRTCIGAKQRDSTSSPPITWWNLLKVAIPALVMVMFALLLVPVWTGWSERDRLTQEIVSCHVRSLLVDHRTDVASSDQHTVKPWFQGKLDFSPPVTDFAEQGFQLAGGRLDYVHGHQAAALVYRHREHVINLFVWPAENTSNSQRRASARHGFNLVRWGERGMNFWAVSDLNQVELWEFSELVNK